MVRWFAGTCALGGALWFALPQPAHADDETARQRIAESVVALGDGHLDEALTLLDRAQGETRAAAVVATVERQRAFVRIAQSEPEAALAALVRARTLDVDLSIGSRSPSRALQSLFDCAGKLIADRREATGKLAEDGVGGWVCPAAPKVEALVSEPPGAPRLEKPVLVAPPVDPPVAPSAGVPTAAWILGGVAVASAGAGGALGAMAIGAATDRDPSTSAGGPSIGANVAFGVAAAALITGAVVWLAN